MLLYKKNWILTLTIRFKNFVIIVIVNIKKQTNDIEGKKKQCYIQKLTYRFGESITLIDVCEI